MCTKFNVQKSILCAKQNLHPPNLSIIIMVLTYRYILLLQNEEGPTAGSA